MRDVVFEWYVPYVLSRKQQLAKAVMISAALVFFVDAVFFAAAMLFPSLILAVTVFFLARSWRYEYEYVYVKSSANRSGKTSITRPAQNLRKSFREDSRRGDARSGTLPPAGRMPRFTPSIPGESRSIWSAGKISSVR